MVGLIRSLSAENSMDFDEIVSFETESYYGMYNHFNDEWIVIAKEDVEFNAARIDYASSLDELDDMVCNTTCGEHIIGVSSRSKYKLTLFDA